MKTIHLKRLPQTMLDELKAMRIKRGLSQFALGKLIGLPQMHISGIETGKIVPRFDTLLDLVRALDYDLMLVPYSLVPVVQSLTRDQNHDMHRPLYAVNEEDDDEGISHDEV